MEQHKKEWAENHELDLCTDTSGDQYWCYRPEKLRLVVFRAACGHGSRKEFFKAIVSMWNRDLDVRVEHQHPRQGFHHCSSVFRADFNGRRLEVASRMTQSLCYISFWPDAAKESVFMMYLGGKDISRFPAEEIERLLLSDWTPGCGEGKCGSKSFQKDGECCQFCRCYCCKSCFTKVVYERAVGQSPAHVALHKQCKEEYYQQQRREEVIQ